MRKFGGRGLVTLAVVGMSGLLLISVACSRAPAVNQPAGNAGNQQVVAPANTVPISLQAPSNTLASELTRVQIGAGQTGISVSGESSITLAPDLALINIGVETTGETVAEAREQATTAMDAVTATLRSKGIADKDIQTQHFNIWSRYEWMEETTEFGPRGREVQVGYSVSNSAMIKVRDLASVGTLIDEAAAAGGDAIRINGVSFTVEDRKPYMEELHEAAISDAVAKANRFASLTGVQLGKLVFLSDSLSVASLPAEYYNIARYEYAAAAPVPATSISGGQLELRMAVQAVFDIQ